MIAVGLVKPAAPTPPNVQRFIHHVTTTLVFWLPLSTILPTMKTPNSISLTIILFILQSPSVAPFSHVRHTHPFATPPVRYSPINRGHCFGRNPRPPETPTLHSDPLRVRSKTSLQAFSTIASAIQGLHGNPNYVLSAILWLSTFGVSLERQTVIGKALSAPLATMALALTTANLGLLPFSSPICKIFIMQLQRIFAILHTPPDCIVF